VRAAVVTAPRTVELLGQALQPLAPGAVRVAIEGGGVCGSNLPVWEGRPWFDYPLSPGAPGHESWGTVVEVAGDVSALRSGDRVAVLADNSFVDALDVPADHLVALPPELTGQPFPGEALGCGFNVAARSGFASGQTVCVVGIGFLGALVTALAADAGAHVIAVSRRPFALDIARSMGAKETVQLGDDAGQVVDDVRRHTGDLCDVVVEAVGLQQTLDLAGWLTRVRGRLVIAGFHQDGQRVVDVQGWNWNGIDVVNAHERDPEVRLGGIRAAVDAVASGRLDPSPLYTHTYSLDGLADAMDAMLERPDGFLKALVLR
jgi:2-desacetyl-2-hydroxyethyl bacteriochlorophyllide A dehydrogenase